MAAYPKPLTTIGPKELVSFPELGIEHVPAKVDTGADSSAIWATAPAMNGDGELSFTLFGPRSRFYTGKKITTTAFRSTLVRNSFGTSEFRYKVRLLVEIDNRKIRGWFTLSDRSDMRYPVLIGRRLLHNKFIVDVARTDRLHGRPSDTPEVAVLGVKSSLTKTFLERVQQASKVGVRFVSIDYDKLMFAINGRHSKVINSEEQDRDLASYKQAYFKSHVRHPEMAAAVAEYLSFHNVFFVDREVASYVSAGKLSEYMRLACHGLPVPLSLCASSALLSRRYDEIVATLGVPFVLKESASNRGRNNFLIASRNDFKEVLSAATRDQYFVAQTYVENDGFYRVYVLGKSVELAVWRASHTHSEARKAHLNKPAGGANASLVALTDLPAKAHDLAIRAAACMDRQIAGVDVLQDKHTKKWYILEVNNAPQLRGGSFVTEKVAMMARYFDKELRENI